MPTQARPTSGLLVLLALLDGTGTDARSHPTDGDLEGSASESVQPLPRTRHSRAETPSDISSADDRLAIGKRCRQQREAGENYSRGSCSTEIRKTKAMALLRVHRPRRRKAALEGLWGLSDGYLWLVSVNISGQSRGTGF